jgi:glycine reductase complex component B subunit gamma
MAKELERAGLPTALVSALPQIPLSIGAPRIVPGFAIVHPLGDPSRPAPEERRYRRAVVQTALAALTTAVTGPTVFEPGRPDTLGTEDADTAS